MFKVGEFARLGQTSIKTLHHYDEIGLLRPVRVDDATSYRYYTAEQLPQLVRILTLKDLGFSLDQIGALIQTDLPREQVAALLRLKQVELTERIRQDQERLERLQQRLGEIEHAEVPGYAAIQIKRVEELKVAAVRQPLGDADRAGMAALIQEGFERLYSKLYRGNVRMNGSSMIYWPEASSPEEPGEVWACMPVLSELPPDALEAGLFLTTLPAVACMASALHQGSVLDSSGTFVALFTWLAEHSYQIDGPRRDLVLRYAGNPQETSLIEYQYPVRPLVPHKENA